MITCSRCGRELTDAVSIARGMGPECWARTLSEARVRNDQVMLRFYGDVILKRFEDGTVATNVLRQVTRHSPTGFEWGYGGSGPADLALNILLMFTSSHLAEGLYQQFKREVIAAMPREGGVIKGDDIRAWIGAHERGEVA